MVERMVKTLISVGRSLVRVVVFVYLPLMIAAIVAHYPYDTDPSIGGAASTLDKSRKFYEVAYTPPEEGGDTKYVEVEKAASAMLGVRSCVESAIEQFTLKDKKVLEIGSGTGTLQDLVADYTGLDIAKTVASYYHKPFVVASATEIPFRDNSFDGAWTVWVLEHIPEPERAMMEMRRVLKPGGILLFAPAWSCTPWAAEGYEVRPYGDFGIGGKLMKASLPVRRVAWFVSAVPIRWIRLAQMRISGGPTRLHYRALRPNYEHYWVPDADAAVSLDPYEAVLWFRSRGDDCLNCGAGSAPSAEYPPLLVIRINKKQTLTTQATAEGAPQRTP